MPKQWFQHVNPNGIEKVSDFFLIWEQWRAEGLVYRGESKEYEETWCQPSILRMYEHFNHVPSHAPFTAEEREQIEHCQADPLATTDPFLKAFLPSIEKDDPNWVPLAQHFGFGTRLLDVTTNPLIGLYFAVKDHPDDDGYLFCFFDNHRQQAKHVSEVGGCSSFATEAEHNMKHASEDPISHDYASLFSCRYQNIGQNIGRRFRPKIPNSRMNAQHGRFLWFPEIERTVHGQLFGLPIPQAAKSSIKSDLVKGYNIDDETMFPHG